MSQNMLPQAIKLDKPPAGSPIKLDKPPAGSPIKLPQAGKILRPAQDDKKGAQHDMRGRSA